ncbi:Polyisoprenoid-binding protein YceI [Mucilaginibacter pineti]|uniref:Polyisoprenoid-binding protein YceI n=1 Tax=Mucilaginibacter pineti TaxID=1391627 RepID=A0A1G7JLC1_9SPHI|nr:YceI family protein [Mucilaginibacter pineti]SDF25752.1 Polyisoprenoid-binding protein YceI [Mucilaginibacter pineti]
MKNLNQQLAKIAALLMIVTAAALPQKGAAQTTYKLTTDKEVNIKVLGSSNVHDWTMTSTAMESQGDFNLADHHLQTLSFRLAVTSLKSEHTSMDDRTYKAVDAKKFPDISYKLTAAEVTTVDAHKYLIKTKGNLTIAGATQPISMDVTAVVNADNTITCSGSKKIQLTDYGIKPPTFMLGAMKVYNDLTIQFNLIYKK